MTANDPRELPLGPVVVDIEGLVLTPADTELLLHPAVGGVILFSRNFESVPQLRQLTSAIHALRSPRLLIAVDQEGGRVQRLQFGFTRLPPMRELGTRWDEDPGRGEQAAYAIGYVLAYELLDSGVDLSFAPVLDIDYGGSSVIGDRALHTRPEGVAALGKQLVAGMRAAGMGAVGKHFPGHGYVRGDSHHEIPTDDRSFDEIAGHDLWPYRTTIEAGLGGIMPAHIVYQKIDSKPAGFSRFWLNDVLRGQLGFPGIVFSDDLSMEGASGAGGMTDRARAAFDAGCDMVLVCNAPRAARDLVAALKRPELNERRLTSLRGKPAVPSLSPRVAEGYFTARRQLARNFQA